MKKLIGNKISKISKNIPYCYEHDQVDAPKCSEECCKFDKCISDMKKNYIINKFTSVNNSGISLNIDGEEYSFDKIIKILKNHKKEEDAKYSKCDRCGDKYLENKKFNMIYENLEDCTDLKPGMAIGYKATPFITGFQIQSTCGNGKKIKLCDNCIDRLIKFINEREDIE